MELEFYNGKRIFITGHTGFKGAWLSKILTDAGALVMGYALNPDNSLNLFSLINYNQNLNSVIGDIKDFDKLQKAFNDFQPEIVFHLAAQPLVLESYNDPKHTYETNVMGTVNLLECVRQNVGVVKSVVNITTDKVYENKEWEWGYRENDNLCGYDPYSNSKSCSELVTQSYKNSFFNNLNIAISTARAGNVIGGGDFAKDRIIPDCFRAVEDNKNIIMRNSLSVRPYQHVLEPLFAYLLIARKQYLDISYAGSYNIGPDDCDCITTGELVSKFCNYWGENTSWESKNKEGLHEANFLKLDCSKFKKIFGWKSRWNVDIAVRNTVKWYRTFLDNKDVNLEITTQIKDFLEHSN